MLNKPQVKNRAKDPKEAVRVQAKAVNHQVVEAEENPLEAAAKAVNHQVVEKALEAAKAKEEKVLGLEMAKAKAKAKAAKVKATEMAKHPLMMEHQVKMLEMISKMRLMLRLKQ